jgi:hypothetical protein
MDNSFRISDILEGWPVAWFEGAGVLYIGNMVHFSDVHPEVLWLYDPIKRERTQIYPQPGDPFRSAYSARLAQVVNGDRCRQRNWTCDPSRFTSDIGTVTVDDATASFAFPVRFEAEGFLDRYEAEDSGKWDDDDYVYIYQLNPLRWRAFSIYDLKPKFGTDSLKQLLTPEKIAKVLDTPSPE